MDVIIAHDINKLIEKIKSKRDYAPATISQLIGLIKRLYNCSSEMGFYEKENPPTKIGLPKLNNKVTECLTKEEAGRLLGAGQPEIDHRPICRNS